MKILHFADLHLGVESYGHIDPATGLSSRLLDFLRVFDEVVDFALKEPVDLVLFAGDAYKSREPTPTQQREFAKRINRLAAGGIPVLLLVGNHDLPNAVGKATATEIFDTLAIKNVTVSGRPAVYRIETASGPVQVASLPWPRRSSLLSKEETKDLNLDQVKRRLEEALTHIIEVHAAGLDPAVPAVLAAHVWVRDARLGSERGLTIGQDHELLPGDVANPAFDYVALGHIHKGQVVKERPPVVYSGSLERLDFNEEADEKGFYVVEIGSGNSPAERSVEYRFRPVAARRFVTISVTVEAGDIDPTATVLTTINREHERVPGAIVRLEISLPAEAAGLVRDAELRSALSEAYHVTIAREVREAARTRLGNAVATATAEELTPLDALKTYLETKKVPSDRASVLLDHALHLLGDGPA